MRALLFGLILLLAASAGGPALAQVSSPLPNPNLALKTFGGVNALARQPDGGYVLGGNFSSINGQPRSNLARLRPDGSLDPDWKPSANGVVRALAVDGNGAVFVGGEFTRIGEQARGHIAKLSGMGAGTPDPDWNPSANGKVEALAIDAGSGSIFVGGWFTTISGQSRKHIAKLSTTGAATADPDWNPSSDFFVEVLALDDRGAIYARGTTIVYPDYTTVSNYLVKFIATGTGVQILEWVPSTPGVSLAVDKSSGAVYVGGLNSRLTRLSSDTGATTAEWLVPGGIGGRVTLVAVDSGKNVIYAGGTFRLKKLLGSGTFDANWNPSFSGTPRTLAIGANGTVHVGGAFSTAGGQTRLSTASIDASGTVSALVDVEVPGYANVLAMQPTGGVIVGGAFYTANGLSRRGLLRLAADGTLDPDWDPSPGSGTVSALAVDPSSGDVFAGGEFDRVGGQTRYYLAKISGTGIGAVDPAWNPSPNDWVTSLAVDNAGAVFVGGLFEFNEGGGQWSIGGQQLDHLAKLSGVGTGAADPDWKPDPDSAVYALAVDSDGSVFVGGQFGQIGGQPRARVAKVAGSGAGLADVDWNPSADSFVRGLVLDGAGSVYARGEFTMIGGQSRNRLAKLAADGTGAADALWNPAPNGNLNGIAIDVSGAIYVGGVFTSIGGQPRSYLAKLSGTGSGAADVRWNPNVSAPGVATVAMDVAGGALYAAGTFTSVGGHPRNGLVAVGVTHFSDGFETPTP